MADAGRPVRGIPSMGPLESAPRKQAHEARQEAVEPCLHKVRFLPGGASVHAAQILVLWNSFQGVLESARCAAAAPAEQNFGCLAPLAFARSGSGTPSPYQKKKPEPLGPPFVSGCDFPAVCWLV